MSHRSKKKRSHLVRNAFLVIFFLLASVILIDALYQSNSGSTQVSTPSTSGFLLSSRDFYIVPTKGDCGFITSTNLKAFILSAELRNNESIPFHFVVAEVSIVNYTLVNGTVISSNEQQSDNVTSYGSSHSFNNIEVYTKIPKSGPKISRIEFIATVYVQEVLGPITIPFSLPNANC
jgi:hypothetical protein